MLIFQFFNIKSCSPIFTSSSSFKKLSPLEEKSTGINLEQEVSSFFIIPIVLKIFATSSEQKKVLSVCYSSGYIFE
jgi:hypothetical protein